MQWLIFRLKKGLRRFINAVPREDLEALQRQSRYREGEIQELTERLANAEAKIQELYGLWRTVMASAGGTIKVNLKAE